MKVLFRNTRSLGICFTYRQNLETSNWRATANDLLEWENVELINSGSDSELEFETSAPFNFMAGQRFSLVSNGKFWQESNRLHYRVCASPIFYLVPAILVLISLGAKSLVIFMAALVILTFLTIALYLSQYFFFKKVVRRCKKERD